ncbi:MAG: hypothetical protein ACLFPJ_04090 [Candidatus Woesearchaeota archaeon]
MVDINWCLKQNKGIKLITPNDNLAGEYIKNAKETLFSLKNNLEDSNMWKATKKYYALYFAVYSLMMKIGIKCEIHECTIELTKYLENFNIFPKDTYKLLIDNKQLRIDNQYCLKNIKVKINYDDLFNFILSIEEKINTINIKEINKIKNNLNFNIN